MCFLALFGAKPWNYYLFDAFHCFHLYVQLNRGLKTITVNRAKFAVNFSFVGLLLQVILSDTSCFGHCCNKNRNIYNIRPNGAKFLGFSC